jgi:hypothetical protein
MKYRNSLLIAAAALVSLGTASVAHARSDVNWSIGINAAPGVFIGAGNARPAYPYYPQPQPVYNYGYAVPQPIYQQPQVIYPGGGVYPSSYYVQPVPVYVRPAPIYYAPRYGHNHHRGHGPHRGHRR